MRFRSVRLENFKCYAEEDLSLDPGVTVIHGLNGSGKSSLLEACFFALYGARALESETLEEVITIGAESCRVELWFAHGGREYRIDREVKLRGEGAKTTTCALETPDEIFEGARDVREEVTRLLRMDSDAFVNCAYVRQGEVNKLINATPGERQDVIDDLLQLGKLEEYRERASDARLGVKHVRDNYEGEFDGVENQIEEKEERGLHDRLNRLERRLGEVTDEIEEKEANRETAVETFEEAESILEEEQQRRKELETVRDAIEDLSERISETDDELEATAERIRSLKEATEELRGRLAETVEETDLDDPDEAAVEARLEGLAERDESLLDELQEVRVEAREHAGEAETHRETAADLEERAEGKREEAAELDDELETARGELAERRERIDELDERIEETTAEFDDAPVDVGEAATHREELRERRSDLREEIAKRRATIEAKAADIEEAEALLEAGKCPECGQDVDGAPHVEDLDEDREALESLGEELADAEDRLETLEADLERAEELVGAADEVETLRSDRDNLEQLVADREDALEEKADRAETKREEATELAEQAAEEREAAEAAEVSADDCRERVAELNAEREELKECRERLETIADLLDDVDENESAIERLRSERENEAELVDELRDRLGEKRDRRDELAETFDEERIEHARSEKERAEQYLGKVDAKLEELREERDELQGRVGGVENEIEELESLRGRRAELRETLDRLDALYEEARELQEMYADLRAELRQRNVETLERTLNETFDLVYGNDAYSRIELDGEYELTVYQKDGEPLDPEQLSGGERALFNLSLRCAIYRLLADGIEGAAPMPPLILDEPTVFLDAGHVSRLVELVESMRELGVEQIVVVSHDDELVGAADDLVTVRKDPTTNRSTVEQREKAGAPASVT